MSISVGAGGVVTVGAIGDSQGARAALSAAPSGCIGIQVVWRGWFDTFTDNATISPYSRYQYTTGDTIYYFNSATWETIFAYGLCFDNVYPTRNTTTSPGLPTTNKSFFGVVTGGGFHPTYNFNYHALRFSGVTRGNVANWVHYGYGSVVGLNRSYTAFLTKQTNSGSSLFASPTEANFNTTDFQGELSNTSFSNSATRLAAFPANPTDGAKFAMGWDIRKSLTDYSVSFRWYINTDSLAEVDLMNVFTTYDWVSSSFQINRSTSTINSDDAWINGSGDFVAPSYVMMRNGLPGQGFTLNKVAYRYLT